ncbi:hypothetical protein E8E13_009287 [Curvularia kusanoi]|uniref:Uncharacterized protein n=1 Tax=Curvularia kusanoi TaxID=90978 RepID=A0A9P4TNE0_CURKU|nr:hypothetical protein E8E13_009287 [Curvularia kusanoi]
MSTALLSFHGDASKSSTLKHKPTELPRQLFHIIRGATDAFEALSLYLELIVEPSLGSNRGPRAELGYQSFDAHVGDTACQLRACMLLEMTSKIKETIPSTTTAMLASTITDLEELLARSRKMLDGLLVLDYNKIRSGGLEELGIPKAGLTTEDLLTKLGWSRQPRSTYQNRTNSSRNSFVSDRSVSSTTSSMADLSMGWNTPASSVCDLDMSATGKPGDGWDLSDIEMVTQFLVSSYVLSKYKRLTEVNGVYHVTLHPELAFQESQSLVPQEFPKGFVRPNKRANGEELLALQRYLSELSCTWLEARSYGSPVLHPNHHALLASTFRTSAKGVKSASSYVGYLTLRGLWGENATPMIIETTRFCPSGFHRNYFRITVQNTADNRGNNTDDSVHSAISWHLTHMTGQELAQFRQCSEPHIVISANSIDGNTSDYLNNLPLAHEHSDDCCSDNKDHCQAMLQSDQDRVVQAIFAEHRHYAFGLSGDEATLGDDIVVQCLMDRYVPGLSNAWQKSKAEAEQLGTGSSHKLCMWQHVFLETPARFLARIEGSDRPWILQSAQSGK